MIEKHIQDISKSQKLQWKDWWYKFFDKSINDDTKTYEDIWAVLGFSEGTVKVL